MSSAAPLQQLLVIGLCGESIMVDWLLQDTVKDIKEKAYAAAEKTSLADGTTLSLVTGVSLDQLFMVFGEPDNPTKLDDSSILKDCLRALLRSVIQMFSSRELLTFFSASMLLRCSRTRQHSTWDAGS